jgi:ribosomal protein S18 acetylase RimI-like enzyme
MQKDGIKIEYLERTQKELDIIRPLWHKLQEHHKAVSKYFKDSPSTVTFDTRKKQLIDKIREGALRIDLAKDFDTGKYIGYCVTSLTHEKQGEIESIYVEKSYRRSGIGDTLMTRALAWLERMAVAKTIIGVSEGNESVFDFYRRYDFYPRVTILAKKNAE